MLEELAGKRSATGGGTADGGDALEALREEYADASCIEADAARERAPLSFAQRSLWLHSRLRGSSPAGFHLPVVLKFHGPEFSVERMCWALERIVERHSILRTVFPAVEGEPEQRILPLAPSTLAVLDIDPADLTARLHDHYTAPFDLEREPPLRAALFRTSPDVHLLSLIVHHIACDGWSVPILLNELRTLYLCGAVLPPLPLQFADYAAWQVQASARHSAETLSFYREAIGDAAAPLRIPPDSDPVAPSLGADAGGGLDAELRHAVRQFGRSIGTTDFAPLVAAYAVLLSLYAGQERFLIGTPVARRDHEECEGLIGCFASTLPIAVRRPLRKSFSGLARELHEGFLAALDLPEVSWEQLASTLGADRGGEAALCQAMFTLQNASPGVFAETVWGELRVEPVAMRTPAARFDILLTLLPDGGGWRANLEYSPDRIMPAHAEGLVSGYRSVLERLIRNPEVPIAELDLFPEEDRAVSARHPKPARSARAPAPALGAPQTGRVSLPQGWTAAEGPADAAAPVLLGRPETGYCLQRGDCEGPGLELWQVVGGAEACVLGPNGLPQPLGAVGELCLGGPAIGQGYPEAVRRTAEKFVPDPHARLPGSRMFRTGLRGRMMALSGRPLQLLPEPDAPLTVSEFPANDLQPASVPQPAAADTAARAKIEAVLRDAWSAALGCGVPGLDENFFALGGDSILCLKVQAIAQRAGVPLAVEDMFEHQTIRTLATATLGRSAGPGDGAATGPFDLVAAADRRRLPDDVRSAYPLSGLQAGMVYHSRLDGSGTYHDIIRYRLVGKYRVEGLQAAVEDVLAEHEVFATTLDLTTYSEPLQLVWSRPRAHVDVTDLRALDRTSQDEALDRWTRAELERDFVLSEGAPFRVGIHALDAQECMLCFSFHHALLDGWSEAMLMRFILDRYEERERGSSRRTELKPSPHRDYVALERLSVSDPDTVQFWTERLQRRAVLDLPPPAADDLRPGRSAFTLSREQAELLQSIAAAWGVPFKSLLLAWHSRVLGRMTGDESVVTGMVFNGRPEGDGGDVALGMYLNTVPVWTNGAGSTWSELARHCFDRESAILPYRRFPLSRIQALAGGRSVFAVAFNYTHFHNAPAEAEDRSLRVARRDGLAKSSLGFVMHFSRDPEGGGLVGVFDAPAGYSRYAEAVRDLYVQELKDLLVFHGGASIMRPGGENIDHIRRPSGDLPSLPAGASLETAMLDIVPDDLGEELSLPSQDGGTLPFGSDDLRRVVRKAALQYRPLEFRLASRSSPAAIEGREAMPASPEPDFRLAEIALRDTAWPLAFAGDVGGAETSGGLMLSRTAWSRSADQLRPMADAASLTARRPADWSSCILLLSTLADLGLDGDERGLWSDAAAEDPRADLCFRLLERATVAPGQVWAISGNTGTRRRYLFGSAETGLALELASSSSEPAGALPVVRPVPGSSLRVVGCDGRTAPVGTVGEVVIETAGLAWGYRGASRITAERFRPASAGSGARAFWTGLIGRICDDGGIVLYGPAGRVPLIGGRWVKMDAIEFVAERVPGVERAVLDLGASGADPQLLLRVHADCAGEAAATVQDRLRSALPVSWVPEGEAIVIHVDELTAPAGGRLSRSPASGAPPNAARDVERVVAAIWAEALEVGDVEPDQDFFRAGGDSIRALRVVAQLEDIFGTEIPLVLIFKHPTLSGFAEALAWGGAWSGNVVETAAALCAEAEDET